MNSAGEPSGQESDASLDRSMLHEALSRSRAARADSLPPGTLLAGDYRVERPLGRGGMGTVHLAWQISLSRQVAIKVLPWTAEHDSQAVDRFVREVEVAGRLHHPHLLGVLDVGTAEGLRWYTMPPMATSLKAVLDAVRFPEIVSPVVGKEDVEQHILETWRPDWYRAIADVMSRVARALAHAHRAQILHRDVKPSNILLADDGSPQLADFGIARDLGSPDLSRTGQVPGTLRYMSREQLSGEPLDARTDVHSLGATLFEALVLYPPFQGTTAAQVSAAILESEYPTPRSAIPDIPRDLDTIVWKAMMPDRRRRYSSSDELAADLERFVAGMPIVARPQGSWRRAISWARRHRPQAIAVAAPLAATVIGAIGYGVAATSAARDIRAASAREAVTVARSHGRRGEWGPALAALDRADTLEYPDAVEVDLLRVEALFANFQSDQALALFRRLGESNLGKHRAAWQLIKGTRASDRLRDEEDGLDALRRAASSGDLVPADQAVAEAFLATDILECLASARLARKLEPGNQLAASLEATTLLALGRPQQALEVVHRIRALSPHNAMGQVYESLCLALVGREREARDALESGEWTLPADVRTFLLALMDCLDVMRHVDAKAGSNAEAGSLATIVSQATELIAPIAALAVSISALSLQDEQSSGLRLHAPIPVSYRGYFTQFTECFGGDLTGPLRMRQDPTLRREMLVACAEFQEEHPLDVVQLWMGMVALVDGRASLAEKVLREVPTLPGFVPFRRAPLIMEWAALRSQLSDTSTRADEGLTIRAEAAGWRAATMGSWNASQWRLFAVSAHQLGLDGDLADALARQWIVEWPDDLDARCLRARVQLRMGNATRAAELATGVQARSPGHAEAQRLLEASSAGIGSGD